MSNEAGAAWLNRATVFALDDRQTIEKCVQRNGTVLWAVRDAGYVLNKAGEWEYEPLPSSRTDAFFSRCRFRSKEEAMQAWKNRKQ